MAGARDGSDDAKRRMTDAGIEVRALYADADLEAFDPARDLGVPGEPPFTRGVYGSMYRGRVWTMRRYAGMGTAADTNQIGRAHV